MASVESRYIATAKADAEGRLIEADEVGRIVTEALADPANSPC